MRIFLNITLGVSIEETQSFFLRFQCSECSVSVYGSKLFIQCLGFFKFVLHFRLTSIMAPNAKEILTPMLEKYRREQRENEREQRNSSLMRLQIGLPLVGSRRVVTTITCLSLLIIPSGMRRLRSHQPRNRKG